MPHRALAAGAVALAAVLLAGCSAAASTTPTATTTVTVTATPAPATPAPRSTDDPLTALDAWLVCWGATYGQNGESSTVMPFSPTGPSGTTVTDKGNGVFEVLVPFAPASGDGPGAEAICDVSGTVGHPTIQSLGGRDFG
jgi:hypothetical protein